METFNELVIRRAKLLFTIFFVILFISCCGALAYGYGVYINGWNDGDYIVCTLLFSLLSVESVFVLWLVKSVGLCNSNFRTLQHEWESIYENCQVGIAFLKNGRHFVKGNMRLADILGYYSLEELLKIDVSDVHLSYEKYKEFGEKYYNQLAFSSRLHIEYKLKRKDGTHVWCLLSGKAVDPSNPSDLSKGVVWIVEDISKQKKFEERLRVLAETDELTGLKNLRSFSSAAQVEIERFNCYKAPLSFVMVDIDHFKSVNDKYGHEVGDAVLREFAVLCCEHFRSIDVIARVGGEEFAILLPAAGLQETAKVLRRFRCFMKRMEIPIGRDILRITASFGVAFATEGINVEKLRQKADKALYLAKKNGRDRVEFFNDCSD